MRIVFLGTSGWYTNPTGNTSCILIDSKEGYIIFDAGNGLYKIDEYIREKKPIFLFITHFHLDHVFGIHILNKFEFTQGIDIYFAKSRKRDFELLVNPPYTGSIDYSKMPIRLHELSCGRYSNPFPVTAIELFHGFGNHGYQVVLEGKIVSYSGDCGETLSSYQLAKDADLLIHECSYSKDKPSAYTWGHATPEMAARIAKEAGVKRLVLTHFDPTEYPNLEDRAQAEKRARKIFPETTAAYDDLVLSL